MAIDSLSKINSYQKISGLEDQIKLVRDLANTKLPLSGGTMTGHITMDYNNPYLICKNKYVPTRVFTDLSNPISEYGYKYTSQGLQYRSNDSLALGGTVSECIHDPRTTSYQTDRITVRNFLQLPVSVFGELKPNESDSSVATRGLQIAAVLKTKNENKPYCQAICTIPYRNSDHGSELVVQSWIRKNLTGLDRIAPDSTILWYNNSTYNVRFAQDGDRYGSKTRPWTGYGTGHLYLKEPFTNFNRLYIIFADDSAKFISTQFVDTYDLDLRMKSYFYPYGSSTPLFLGIKNGISTTESGNVTTCELFNGGGSIVWEIFGYNNHHSNNDYKSTSTYFREYNENCRILCIIGIGRKSQTTWNP